MSLDAVASAVTTGHDKVAEALNVKVKNALTTGDNKLEAVLLDTKTSLDNIKGAVDVQNERILTGLTSVATNVKEAGDNNQAELSKLGDHTETAATNLNTLATNVKEAGTSNKESLDAMAANVKQAGDDNLAGLTSLGTHTEAAATNVGTLAANVAKAGSDSKESLDDISAKINSAAGHLEKSATNSDTFVTTFTQFSADSKANLNSIKDSLDSIAVNNKEGLTKVYDSIKEFTTSATTDTGNIVKALSDFEASLEISATELETELDVIRQAIVSAQGKTQQLAAIKRLADKIECTENCFMSDAQADAIIAGLDSNDENLNNLVGDLNRVASNDPGTSSGTAEAPTDKRLRRKKDKRSQNSVNELQKKQKKFASRWKEQPKSKKEDQNSFFDLMVGLQNPEFNITKYMKNKGHDFQEFADLVENITKSSKETFNERYENFLQTSGLLEKIPESLDINYLRRNGRSLIDVGKSASSIINIKNFMDKSKYFSKKNNASFFETILSEDDIQEILNQFPKKGIKTVQKDASKITKTKIPIDVAKYASNFLVNPLLTWPFSFAFQELLNPIYDNDNPFWKRLAPEGYLKKEEFLDNIL